MTLSLLRKRYLGTSWASKSENESRCKFNTKGQEKVKYVSIRSYNLLRSWILRKMKKMRTAMRTMTIPAPMTIPII